MEATQRVDILEFVEGREIDPAYFDRPYYLAPDKSGTRAYVLLRETLRRTGRVGIARVVIRTRQYLAAVYPRGDVIVLNLLRYAHELRSIEDLDIAIPGARKLGLEEREFEMAEKLWKGCSAGAIRRGTGIRIARICWR